MIINLKGARNDLVGGTFVVGEGRGKSEINCLVIYFSSIHSWMKKLQMQSVSASLLLKLRITSK